MKLLNAAKLTAQIEMELPDEQLEILLTQADAFLRAGGHVSLSEWLELTAIERSAMMVAGDRLAFQNAALTGQASQGPDGLAETIAPIDNGETREAIALTRAAEAAALKLENEPIGVARK